MFKELTFKNALRVTGFISTVYIGFAICKGTTVAILKVTDKKLKEVISQANDNIPNKHSTWRDDVAKNREQTTSKSLEDLLMESLNNLKEFEA